MLAPDIIRQLVEICPETKLRRGQAVDMHGLRANAPLVVIRGIVMLESWLADERRQVLAFGQPGDLLQLSAFAGLPRLALVALEDVRVCHLDSLDGGEVHANGTSQRSSHDHHAGSGGVGLTRFRAALVSAQQIFESRQSVHSAILCRLTSEERVATILFALATHSGLRRDAETVFRIPLSRADLADYLGLNADTLSRVISKLRSDGIVRLNGRAEVHVPSLSALAALTPIADAVRLAWRPQPRAITETAVLA